MASLAQTRVVPLDAALLAAVRAGFDAFSDRRSGDHSRIASSGAEVLLTSAIRNGGRRPCGAPRRAARGPATPSSCSDRRTPPNFPMPSNRDRPPPSPSADLAGLFRLPRVLRAAPQLLGVVERFIRDAVAVRRSEVRPAQRRT